MSLVATKLQNLWGIANRFFPIFYLTHIRAREWRLSFLVLSDSNNFEPYRQKQAVGRGYGKICPRILYGTG